MTGLEGGVRPKMNFGNVENNYRDKFLKNFNAVINSE